MTGHGLGLLSLRIDALYCGVLGVGVLVGAQRVAPAVALPTAVVASLGAAVLVWAAAVAVMVVRLPLRPVLRVVAVANLVAGAVIAAFSIAAAGALVVLALLAIAVDVVAFAASQALALSRLKVRPDVGRLA